MLFMVLLAHVVENSLNSWHFDRKIREFSLGDATGGGLFYIDAMLFHRKRHFFYIEKEGIKKCI